MNDDSMSRDIENMSVIDPTHYFKNAVTPCLTSVCLIVRGIKGECALVHAVMCTYVSLAELRNPMSKGIYNVLCKKKIVC
jgi:hypothetical protein